MVWAHSALAQPANLNHAAGTFDGQFGDTYKFARQDWERRRVNRKGRDYRSVESRSNATAMSSYAAAFSFSGSLVAEARRYLGTNPTGWRNRWCGAFMDMVLKRTGHKGGGNLALAYAKYGRRISGPQIGAIAVMTRRGGGHVGVVSGIDPNGNPIVVSGNHNDIVAEAVYPRSRIIAYVVPH
jgi:uncharacterized protein (TIGR02594 family)